MRKHQNPNDCPRTAQKNTNWDRIIKTALQETQYAATHKDQCDANTNRKHTLPQFKTMSTVDPHCLPTTPPSSHMSLQGNTAPTSRPSLPMSHTTTRPNINKKSFPMGVKPLQIQANTAKMIPTCADADVDNTSWCRSKFKSGAQTTDNLNPPNQKGADTST